VCHLTAEATVDWHLYKVTILALTGHFHNEVFFSCDIETNLHLNGSLNWIIEIDVVVYMVEFLSILLFHSCIIMFFVPPPTSDGQIPIAI